MTRHEASVVCPACGQPTLPPANGFARAHCDGAGKPCGFSGEPFGAIAQGRDELFEDVLT